MAPRESDSGLLLKGFHKYPSLRDSSVKGAATWMKGKKMDDDYGALWRVHDKLYDLSRFIDKHPGGSQWLQVTRGTDITELFECSHPNPNVDKILAKYFVEKTDIPRNSPYSLEPDGFYLTLKRRVYKKLQSLSPQVADEGRKRVIRVQNQILATLALLFASTLLYESYALAVLTGIVLFCNVNCAHNFYHQRDNWRMFCWDLGLLSSYEWRITHAMSHHIYTNTIYDYEMSGFEPLFDFKASPSKNWMQRFGMKLAGHLLYPMFFFFDGVKRVVFIVSGQQNLRPENLLPLFQLLVAVLFTNHWTVGFKLWLVVQASASYLFGFIGVIAAHHHPDIYHAGDEFALGSDWGLCQLDAVRDRRDVNGNLLAELISYGNHVLHHLFPTVDHGLLSLLQDDFMETCRKFHVDNPEQFQQSLTQWDRYTGMLEQLARVAARKRPRDQN